MIKITADNVLMITGNLFDLLPGGQHVNITAANCVGIVANNVCNPSVKVQSASPAVMLDTKVPPFETIPSAPPYALPAAGTFGNVPGLTFTAPVTGSYVIYAKLRYYSNTSANTDSYFVAQLAVNGQPVNGTQTLLFDSLVPGLIAGTGDSTYRRQIQKGDVVTCQVKRDGQANWTAAQILHDGNGFTIFGYTIAPE